MGVPEQQMKYPEQLWKKEVKATHRIGLRNGSTPSQLQNHVGEDMETQVISGGDTKSLIWDREKTSLLTADGEQQKS